MKFKMVVGEWHIIRYNNKYQNKDNNVSIVVYFCIDI
jgi:hypothetical protein